LVFLLALAEARGLAEVFQIATEIGVPFKLRNDLRTKGARIADSL